MNASPKHRAGPLVRFAALCAWAVTLPVAAARAEAPVEQLIEQLETPDFELRAEAETALYGRGVASIDRLTEAALSRSPELEARIVRVLRRMYLSENLELSDRAAAALENLAGARGLESARAALRSLEPERQAKAIAAIRDLGGMVRLANRDDDAVGPIIEEIRLDESWKGGTEGLRHVGRISQPERFMVTVIDDCGVGQEDIQKLRIDLPQLQPQFRGAATLGIGPDNFAVRGCVVGRVLPGNAADKAGIQSGDRILKIGETEVENFEGLVNHLRTRKVGDEVEIVVERDGEEIMLSATLQTWKSIDKAVEEEDEAPAGPVPGFIIPPRRRVAPPPPIPGAGPTPTPAPPPNRRGNPDDPAPSVPVPDAEGPPPRR